MKFFLKVAVSLSVSAVFAFPLAGQTTSAGTSAILGSKGAQERANPASARKAAQNQRSATQLNQPTSLVPQVQFSKGMLTIHAHNSSLADVLTAVRRKTGAQVDVPPSASSERVAADLGPGPADEVLAKLLNGSKYDYVILASARDPRDLSYIMLQEKSGGSQDQNQASFTTQQPAPVEQEAPEAADEEPQPEEPAQPEPPAGEQPDTQTAQPQPPAPDNGNNGEYGTQQAPKTPEQLLEELKQMQQQQQQQNQPGTPVAPQAEQPQQPPQQQQPGTQPPQSYQPQNNQFTPGQEFPPEQNQPPQ
jgi:hypothetical protein